jgi:hypothetical protein
MSRDADLMVAEVLSNFTPRAETDLGSQVNPTLLPDNSQFFMELEIILTDMCRYLIDEVKLPKASQIFNLKVSDLEKK